MGRTLPYAAAPRRKRSLAWGYQLLLASAVALSALLFLGLLTIAVPAFTGIFRDFKTELPLSTRLAVNLSRHTVNFGWLVVLALAALLIIVGIALDLLTLDLRALRRYTLILVVLLLLTDLLGLVLFTWAMFAPMLSLLSSVH